MHSFKSSIVASIDCTNYIRMVLNTSVKVINRLSSLFQPINVVPKGAVVKRQELMSNSQKVRKYWLLHLNSTLLIIFSANDRVRNNQASKHGMLSLVTFRNAITRKIN